MKKNREKIIAKKIKQFLALILIAALANGVTYIVLAVSLAPPVNPPVKQEIKQRIKENRGGTIYAGDAFKEHSKYDKHLTLYDVEYDKINEKRNYYYKKELNNQFNKTWPWIFAIIVLGYYLIKGIKWVLVNAKEETNKTIEIE